MDLLYIIFTYYTQDNNQECFRFSNWFSMWCSRPWLNHLPPVWWFNFRFIFSERKLVCKFDIAERNFLLMLVLIIVFIRWPNTTFIIPHIVSLWNSSFNCKCWILSFSIDVVSTLSYFCNKFTTSHQQASKRFIRNWRCKNGCSNNIKIKRHTISMHMICNLGIQLILLGCGWFIYHMYVKVNSKRTQCTQFTPISIVSPTKIKLHMAVEDG